MKPFTLHTVLKHRKNLEEQAIYHLARAREEEASVQRQVDNEEKALATLIENLATEQTLGIEVNRLAQFEQRIDLVKKQLLALQSLLHQKTEKVIRAQAQLISKSKDRKIMETLKEKQDEAWRHYLDQKETAALDEVAVIFHGRK